MATLSTPAAIVVGSVIVGSFLGAGAYFGLHDRNAARSGAPPAAEALASPLPAGSAATPAQPVPAGRSASDVRAEVAAAFEQARSALARQCWEPALKDPGPASETFRVHLIFDANGEQLGRSFIEGPGGRAGVARCLSTKLAPLHVSPPGAKVTLEVPFQVP